MGTSRRVQRSTRVTLATLLVVLAALLLVTALVWSSYVVMLVAAVLGVALGGAATKIVHSELVQSRRDAARDRAVQAHEYLRIADRRTAEHRAHSALLTQRVEHSRAQAAALTDELVIVHRQLATTRGRLGEESRRARQAEQHVAQHMARISELQGELAAERAETRAARAELQVWKSRRPARPMRSA